ncbi:MAG: DNA topoisomerase VI subunit B [Thermoplasmata archaeon]|nr:DNA topoisomerase VI subunit B [Thermoplasmata archaeon]MCI4338485.1 DNA topoisomerase VI subunit B [Thermoplasmata archaeon]MCI4341207.1 DNA topoisomerase VI subunit B [Thermoplasmata archaeon]
MPGTPSLAQQLGAKQREISVAEFFERNRQILGFDNPLRAALTTVKEAVDNALDACEEARVLPEIQVEIAKEGTERLRIAVEDNGPGIVKKQIPNVFARLLYGSRFHANRQSRGQQGIGISAAVLYAALTTARPARIRSKVAEEEAAHVAELLIDTQHNQPRIVSEELELWDRPQGTRVELVLKARYTRGRQSPFDYLRNTAIVNPHARIVLIEPDGTRITWDRVSTEVPPVPKEIPPHPHGLELGELAYRLKASKFTSLRETLTKDFAGVTPRALREVLALGKFTGKESPEEVHGEELERLLRVLHEVPLLPPNTEALSPIGPLLIKRGLRNVLGEIRPDFFAPPVSRPPKVRGGNPFLVEVGLVYGGGLPADQPMQLLRFANRVPLLFQQGACAITTAVSNLDWRRYGLDQKGGNGLPVGPCLLLVHLASTKVPFTSEAKEAVAEDPEIDKELTLALQGAARHLRTHLSRRSRRDLASEKFIIIQRILPQLAEKASRLAGKPVPDLTPVITKIMDVVALEATSGPGPSPSESSVTVELTNYTPRARVLELFVEMPPEDLASATLEPLPEGTDAELGRAWWTLEKLAPSARSRLTLRFPKSCEVELNDLDWFIAGVDEAHLLGAESLPGDWEVRLPRAIIEAAEGASAESSRDEAEVDYDGEEAHAALEDE